MFLTDEYRCAVWPESQTYGCTSGGNWKSLNPTMTISDFVGCETLCLQERKKGCCYLKDGHGCYWKAGQQGLVSQIASGIAVTCKEGISKVLIKSA